MSQAELNSIQDTINTFVSSPIPDATLYFTDIETITATLQTFGTTMYMQTGRAVAGWTDAKQLLAVITAQLKPYQKDLEAYGSRLITIQIFLTIFIQPALSNPSVFIKGVQKLGRQHRVFIDDESFDPVKLLDAAGIESYPQLPEMIYVAKRGIQIDHDVGYALFMPDAKFVPHATRIGRYEWKAVTAKRMYHESFYLAEHLRGHKLEATTAFNMPTPVFIALMVDFYTRMYAEALQTPKRWTPEAFETLLADVHSTLPSLGFHRYKRVMKLAVTTLADEEKLSRKQAMALLQVL